MRGCAGRSREWARGIILLLLLFQAEDLGKSLINEGFIDETANLEIIFELRDDLHESHLADIAQEWPVQVHVDQQVKHLIRYLFADLLVSSHVSNQLELYSRQEPG